MILFFLLANMFSLLYVFLWECVRSSASNVFAFFIYFLRANAFLLLVLFFVSCEIWVYEICFIFVFHVYGLIRLVWQPFQLS